jgi:diguanylate cyclase (GGDEF)-like protein
MILSREKTKKESETDLLTGLTARIAAQQEIEEHLRTDEHGVMMLLDLDRFKHVNDRLGHQMGDKVLIDVAGDMKKLFRNSDVLSRLGGDEFVVYLRSVPEKNWAEQRAADIVRGIRRWVSNGTINIQITASVGIVMTDMVERSYDALYRAADIAMYTAKGQGGNQALLYTPEMAARRENAERILEEAPGRNGASTKCI